MYHDAAMVRHRIQRARLSAAVGLPEEPEMNLRGWQEGMRGQLVPVYRIRGWRTPNEDGAERLMHVQWDGSLSPKPLRQPECLRCYPRCFRPIGHSRNPPPDMAG